VRLGLFVAVTFAAACGGDSAGPDVDPAVAPFVGTWIADSMAVTSQADTTLRFDLLAAGATFSIVVQPSGQYTATLGSFTGTSVEIGDMTVLGASSLELRVSYPPPGETQAMTYQFATPDHLVLDGATEWNGEPAYGHIELNRQ
jgi:hypothetical protein